MGFNIATLLFLLIAVARQSYLRVLKLFLFSRLCTSCRTLASPCVSKLDLDVINTSGLGLDLGLGSLLM